MKKTYKEPIQFKKMWLVLIVIVLIGVPWYLPQGLIYPIILGFPFWGLISLVSSIALSVFLRYFIENCWDMESLKKEEILDTEGGE